MNFRFWHVVLISVICLLIPGLIGSQIGQEPKSVLAVIQLQALDGVSASDALLITHHVEEAVFRTGQYDLVERSRHHIALAVAGGAGISDLIEQLQDRISERHGFILEFHRMELYGRCGECRNKKKA